MKPVAVGTLCEFRYEVKPVAVELIVNTPSVEPVLRSRLLPPVSFRTLFALTTAGAIAFALARAAGRGAAFAMAIEVAFGFLVLCFLMFAVLFLIAWLYAAVVIGRTDVPDSGSPFAEDRLPPQLLPPRERPS